ncbi:hypothetical protein U1Q18_003058, partial [Sarracenia purpurea var. burkii]
LPSGCPSYGRKWKAEHTKLKMEIQISHLCVMPERRPKFPYRSSGSSKETSQLWEAHHCLELVEKEISNLGIHLVTGPISIVVGDHEQFVIIKSWNHSRASLAISTMSPLRRNIASGKSSLDFPPRRKIALWPKLMLTKCLLQSTSCHQGGPQASHLNQSNSP